MTAILHLNVELVREVTKIMYDELGHIMDAKHDVLNDTKGFLQVGWSGPAHDEFVGLWEEWDMLMGRAITSLAVLQDNLVLEANKWENATDRFSYRSE